MKNDVLEEIGEESDQEEVTDTGEKSDTDQDYDESDNKSDVGNDYEDDEDSDKDDYDDNDVGDNEGLQISDILCTTKSGRTCRTSLLLIKVWRAKRNIECYLLTTLPLFVLGEGHNFIKWSKGRVGGFKTLRREGHNFLADSFPHSSSPSSPLPAK